MSEPAPSSPADPTGRAAAGETIEDGETFEHRLTRLVLGAAGRLPLRAVAPAVEAAVAARLVGAVIAVEVVQAPLELGLAAGPALPDAMRRAAYPASAIPNGPLIGASAAHHRRPRAEWELPPGSLAYSFGLRAAAAPALWHGQVVGAISAYWATPPRLAERLTAERLLVDVAGTWASALGALHVGRAAVLQSRRWRQELAGEIHDDALQSLIGADLRLQRLAGRLEDPVQADLLREARSSNADALQDVRRLLHRLRGAETGELRSAGEILRRVATTMLDGTVHGGRPGELAWTLLADGDLPLGPQTRELFAELSADALDAVLRAVRPTSVELGVRTDGICVVADVDVVAPGEGAARAALESAAHTLAPVLAVTGGEAVLDDRRGARPVLSVSCPMLG